MWIESTFSHGPRLLGSLLLALTLPQAITVDAAAIQEVFQKSTPGHVGGVASESRECSAIGRDLLARGVRPCAKTAKISPEARSSSFIIHLDLQSCKLILISISFIRAMPLTPWLGRRFASALLACTTRVLAAEALPCFGMPTASMRPSTSEKLRRPRPLRTCTRTTSAQAFVADLRWAFPAKSRALSTCTPSMASCRGRRSCKELFT